MSAHERLGCLLRNDDITCRSARVPDTRLTFDSDLQNTYICQVVDGSNCDSTKWHPDRTIEESQRGERYQSSARRCTHTHVRDRSFRTGQNGCRRDKLQERPAEDAQVRTLLSKLTGIWTHSVAYQTATHSELKAGQSIAERHDVEAQGEKLAQRDPGMHNVELLARIA